MCVCVCVGEVCREVWSPSVPCLSAGIHCTPGPKARTEPRRTPRSPPHRSAPKTSTPTRRTSKQASKWYYTTYTHSVFAQGRSVYSRHIQYTYIHTHTHTAAHTHLRKYRVGGQALPLFLSLCGGVVDSGLVFGTKASYMPGGPTPTGRIYPAGSLPPGSRSESLTLTEAFPQCQPSDRAKPG